MHKLMLPFDGEGDRNFAWGLRNKSSGLWVEALQLYQWSESSCDTEYGDLEVSQQKEY